MSETQLPSKELDPQAARYLKLVQFLKAKYVQRADARQREMGLQYMEAETHDLACTIIDFLNSTAHEPPAVHSDAVNAARNALTADTNVTYPSRVSARHIRHVLRELLAEHVRLHTLYQATCATYCREHEAASSQPPSVTPSYADLLTFVTGIAEYDRYHTDDEDEQKLLYDIEHDAQRLLRPSETKEGDHGTR